VPSSDISGDIAVSPINGDAITGFSLIADSTTTFSTSTQVTGKVCASDDTSPTPSKLTTAVSAMEAAYTDAASRSSNVILNLADGLIGGVTLEPGVYNWGSNVEINSDIYINGGPDDIFILQTTGNVILAAGVLVTLQGEVKASNIFWQVAGFVDVGTTAHMEGVIIAMTKVVFKTGSSLTGRIFSQTAVTLDSATITQPRSVTD
jgi:hypothetical protein